MSDTVCLSDVNVMMYVLEHEEEKATSRVVAEMMREGVSTYPRLHMSFWIHVACRVHLFVWGASRKDRGLVLPFCLCWYRS